MHWYSTLKSILFPDRRSARNPTARRHRHQAPKLPPLRQPALVAGTLAGGTLASSTLASVTLDRRAIRLRRD